MHWIRQAPVTSEMLVLCVALFVCCAFQAMVDHVPFDQVQREWGAVRERVIVESHDGVRRTPDCELRGPFDVWNGEFWRIPLAAFHHRNLIDLLVCSAFALYLGRFIEDEWGSFWTMTFLIPATSIPIMAELAVGNAVMGLSGTVWAMFGVICILRTFDERLAQEFGLEKVVSGATILLLITLAGESGIIHSSNVSHIAGLAYGACVASVFHPTSRRTASFRAGVTLLHLSLVPGLMVLSYPVWIGPYHWYQASRTRAPGAVDAELERAVACDPQLVGAWLRLSQVAEERGELIEAWNRLIRGLKRNPLNLPLMDSTRRLWRHFDLNQRRMAETKLTQSFGKRSSVWLQAIKSPTRSPDSPSFDEKSSIPEVLDLRSMSLDQKVEISPWEFPLRQKLRGKPVEREEPNDAAEGLTL